MHTQEVTKFLVRSVPIRCNNSNSNQTAISEKGYGTTILISDKTKSVNRNENIGLMNERPKWTHTTNEKKKRAKYKTKQTKTHVMKRCESTEKLMVLKQKSRIVCLVLVLLIVSPRFGMGAVLKSKTIKWHKKQMKRNWFELTVCVLNFDADEWQLTRMEADCGVFSIQITAAYHWVLLVLIAFHSILFLFLNHSLVFIGTVSLTAQCHWQTNDDHNDRIEKLCVFR